MFQNIEKLTIVRVGNVLTFSTLNEIGKRIVAAFDGIIRDYRLSHHETPITESVDAFLLTMILHHEFG